jgi:hypothetical protein
MSTRSVIVSPFPLLFQYKSTKGVISRPAGRLSAANILATSQALSLPSVKHQEAACRSVVLSTLTEPDAIICATSHGRHAGEQEYVVDPIRLGDVALA